jgi:HAD domain in Swiss Army Knife RNA repair proteins
VRNHQKPLLFVDIDGVLSLFGFRSDSRPPGSWINVDGVPHLISATASEHLHRLASLFDLVWCTGWEEKANEHLLRTLMLAAPLPFLTFRQALPDASQASGARHWKLAAIEAHADQRPLAWIDDAHDDGCRAWAAARRAATLLVATEPPVGLTGAHVAELERWARDLRPRHSAR